MELGVVRALDTGVLKTALISSLAARRHRVAHVAVVPQAILRARGGERRGRRSLDAFEQVREQVPKARLVLKGEVYWEDAY